MSDFVIPAEAVEDVAKAIYEAPHDGLSRKGYEAAPRDIQDLYRAEARLALTAARPHLRAHQIETQPIAQFNFDSVTDAAETKRLIETATQLGRALGRAEAAEEIAEALEAVDSRASTLACAAIARDHAHQPPRDRQGNLMTTLTETLGIDPYLGWDLT